MSRVVLKEFLLTVYKLSSANLLVWFGVSAAFVPQLAGNAYC